MRTSTALLSLGLLSLVAACEEDGRLDVSDDATVDPVEPSDSDAEPDDTGPPPDPTDTDPVDPVPPLGDPIELAPDQLEQWVWITSPDMRCSDGSAGGFAVNFTDASRELLVFLQGGGICYDALTCAVGGAPSSVGSDPLFTALDGPIRDNRGMFDRADEANPFRHSNFVVVPHCTGDHHTGDRVANHGTGTFHHVGYTNITRMLERVVPTFSDASRVVLSGFSAGGVGITANYHQLASAFESLGQPPPYLVIDSGPFMRPPHLKASAQDDLREAWGLDGTIGTFCPSCLADGFHEMYRVNAELHPGLRSSLIVTYGDTVVQLLYGVLNKNLFGPTQMREGLVDLADWGEATLGATSPSLHRVFLYEGTRHGALHYDRLPNTPGLAEFIDGQLGTGDWASVRE